MRTRAERRGDRWVLNGRKTWITAGPIADLFLGFASTDPSKGILGISAFLIERGTPGFRVVREIPKMGMRTVPMGELAFEDCVLPPESLLGREGRGASIFNAGLELERGVLLAFALGTMRRQLERCTIHARTRKQFGQPIGKFQSVSNRIVDMAVRLETSRLLVYRYAWLKSAGTGGRRRRIDGQAPRLRVLRPEQPGRGTDLRGLGLRRGDRARARPPRQRRQRDLLGHE